MAKWNRIRRMAQWPALVLIILSLGTASVSLGYQVADGGVSRGYVEAVSLRTISKILSVLEIRSSDPKVLDKAAEKLSAMSTRDIQLISSLCERISSDSRTAGADIAFSLITAMIVLS